jgi:heme A synthase
MATKIAKIVFGLLGLLFVVVALVPALRGEPIDTGTLTTAVVLLLLALVLRPRRPSGPPPEPGA